jgi:hypothetical protein
MKIISLAVIMGTLAFSAASAQQQPRRPYLYAPGTTIGMSSAPIDMSRPNSPVSASSGDVTHPDEQLRGLVPGNPAADGGVARNQGG